MFIGAKNWPVDCEQLASHRIPFQPAPSLHPQPNSNNFKEPAHTHPAPVAMQPTGPTHGSQLPHCAGAAYRQPNADVQLSQN